MVAALVVLGGACVYAGASWLVSRDDVKLEELKSQKAVLEDLIVQLEYTYGIFENVRVLAQQAYTLMEAAKSNFLAGGYVIDNEPPGSWYFEKCINKLANYIENVDILFPEITATIEAYKKDISDIQQKINEMEK